MRSRRTCGNWKLPPTVNWKLHAVFALVRHEAYNEDTSLRIKRSQRNRFVNGRVFQFTVFGSIKPPGAKSDNDVRKNPAAEPIRGSTPEAGERCFLRRSCGLARGNRCPR